jgi:hypothetical protein
MIIDSPNQQAQDDHSLSVMLRFIVERQPTGTQLILATEKTMDIELGGKLIEIDDKYHLLNVEDYEIAKEEVVRLIKASIRS